MDVRTAGIAIEQRNPQASGGEMIGASLIVWFLMQSQQPYHATLEGVGPPAYTWDEIHDSMDLVTPTPTPCKGNEYSDGHGHCINPLLHWTPQDKGIQWQSQRPWDDYGDCYIYQMLDKDGAGNDKVIPITFCKMNPYAGHVTSESYSPYPPCSNTVNQNCIPQPEPVTHGCWYDYHFHDWVCEVHRNGWLYWCLPNAQTPDGSCSSIPWK